MIMLCQESSIYSKGCKSERFSGNFRLGSSEAGITFEGPLMKKLHLYFL